MSVSSSAAASCAALSATACGPQYTAIRYTAIRYAERLADLDVIASIGTVGDSCDNALVETVVGLYRTECVKIDGPFRTADEFELATLS